MRPFLKLTAVFITTLFYMGFYVNASANVENLHFLSENHPELRKSKEFNASANTENEPYKNQIFDSQVKTMLLYPTSSELNPPIIKLNGNEKLVLKFDDFSEGIRDMYYRFEHCTHDWKPSGLHTMDFQEGYNTDYIDDYQFSFNTIHAYTHYHLEFPNDNIKLTASGNYVIKVFVDDDEDQPVLTARFMIVEPLVNIDAKVERSPVVAERNYLQKLNIKVNLGGVTASNPYRDIELVVMQNNRLDNAKRGLKPSFINGNQLTYDFADELTFDGMNEFRSFDAKSVKYRSDRVTRVDLENDGYHLHLSPDVRRAFMRYSSDNDINGKLLIKNDDMQNASLESDYVTVHFFMPMDAFLGQGEMYLFGQLSNWEINPDFKMEYNPRDLRFEKTLVLKQGYYNYLYLWKDKNQNAATTELTEGNHFETENEYTILIYYKDSTSFSDRLVGYRLVNSYQP